MRSVLSVALPLGVCLLAAFAAPAFLGRDDGAEAVGISGPDLAGLAALAGGGEEAVGLPPWQPTFPRDHGAHPEARSETWSVAAHLTDEDGAAVVLSFSLARLGLPPGPEAPDNPWSVDAIYFGQLGVTDAATGAARSERRAGRGLGIEKGEAVLDDLSLAVPRGDAAGFLLDGRLDGMPLNLMLEPRRERLLMGEEGGPVRGYAVPRLAVEGTLGAGDGARRLTGTAWLDHLWGALPPPGGPLTRNRMIVQLDDGSDLSLLRTARADGRGSATVDGVIVAPDGTVTDVSGIAALDPLGDPSEWHVTAPGLDLSTGALVRGAGADGVGAVLRALTVSGTRNGVPVSGWGTLQADTSREGAG